MHTINKTDLERNNSVSTKLYKLQNIQQKVHRIYSTFGL